MVTNHNEFKGQTVFIQVNIFNYPSPVEVPKTIPKKDALSLINKVMRSLLSFIKWASKIILLIIPLHSG